jgi:hypothetical protein
LLGRSGLDWGSVAPGQQENFLNITAVFAYLGLDFSGLKITSITSYNMTFEKNAEFIDAVNSSSAFKTDPLGTILHPGFGDRSRRQNGSSDSMQINWGRT